MGGGGVVCQVALTLFFFLGCLESFFVRVLRIEAGRTGFFLRSWVPYVIGWTVENRPKLRGRENTNQKRGCESTCANTVLRLVRQYRGPPSALYTSDKKRMCRRQFWWNTHRLNLVSTVQFSCTLHDHPFSWSRFRRGIQCHVPPLPPRLRVVCHEVGIFPLLSTYICW